jgi:hypothetical protein
MSQTVFYIALFTLSIISIRKNLKKKIALTVVLAFFELEKLSALDRMNLYLLNIFIKHKNRSCPNRNIIANLLRNHAVLLNRSRI